MSEVGKEHGVFEKVYSLELDKKTNENYKESQNGGKTAFGYLKI
jgi:hypothetical protein